MLSNPDNQALSSLRRIWRNKQPVDGPGADLAPELVNFFKHSVQKRQVKLARISECWSRLVPEMLNDHCALESLHRGSLTVLVDSAAHLYELKQLLLAGLERQLLVACKSAGLRKINLKRGRWYDGDSHADRKVRFS